MKKETVTRVEIPANSSASVRQCLMPVPAAAILITPIDQGAPLMKAASRRNLTPTHSRAEKDMPLDILHL